MMMMGDGDDGDGRSGRALGLWSLGAFLLKYLGRLRASQIDLGIDLLSYLTLPYGLNEGFGLW
jgi:hypothetical protein